jgi:hypothetical protein
MAESLVLFESVINSRWFLRTLIILFLNKIFKSNLPKVSYLPGFYKAESHSTSSSFCRFRSKDISPSTPPAPTSTSHLMALHASKPRAAKRIPAVSPVAHSRCLVLLADSIRTSLLQPICMRLVTGYAPSGYSAGRFLSYCSRRPV